MMITNTIFSDVKSTNGQIKFDVQLDGQPEMILDVNGLGIGVSPSENLHVKGNVIISKQLFVGGANGSSNLNVNGTIGYAFQTIAASTTLSGNSMIFADSSSANLTLSLPEASAVPSLEYRIKKISPLNNVFIRGGGFFDDYSDLCLSLNAMGSLDLISNGEKWNILNVQGNGTSISNDNLIAWWKLNEDSGTTASDSSLHSNDGTLAGTTTFSANGTVGKFDRALSFDGSSNNYISAGSDTSLDNWSSFTVTAWVKPLGSSDGAFSAILGTGLSGANSFGIYSDKNPNTFTMRIGGASQATSGGAFTIGEWTFITALWNGANIYVYKNGVLSGSAANWSGTVNASASVLEIGKIFDRPTYYWNGLMDDIRIYDKALTQTEITALHQQGQ